MQRGWQTRCTGILPTFTYTRAQRNQYDHQDTDHKGGIHPNSTLPERKQDPQQQRKTDVDNNRDEVSQKKLQERPESTRSETKKLGGE